MIDHALSHVDEIPSGYECGIGPDPGLPVRQIESPVHREFHAPRPHIADFPHQVGGQLALDVELVVDGIGILQVGGDQRKDEFIPRALNVPEGDRNDLFVGEWILHPQSVRFDRAIPDAERNVWSGNTLPQDCRHLGGEHESNPPSEDCATVIINSVCEAKPRAKVHPAVVFSRLVPGTTGAKGEVRKVCPLREVEILVGDVDLAGRIDRIVGVKVVAQARFNGSFWLTRQSSWNKPPNLNMREVCGRSSRTRSRRG